MIDWQELAEKFYMKTFKRIPLTIVKGRGAVVWDDKGNEYLDFVGGWAVNSLGHAHPVIANAVTEQVNTLIHTSNQFYTIPQVKLAELLIKNSCLDEIFFCNSGAEANEGAVKLARRYGALKLNGAYEVITTFESFHGRTLAMVAATGQQKHQEPYQPVPDGFKNVPYNDIEAIKQATSEKTCGIMLEPVQGEGGVNLPHKSYLKQVMEWCHKNGMLFILDEIQTGIGRTGTLFAYQQYDVEPDIMTLAKGLAGGLPIGAILAKKPASVFQAGEHGSTFGGNPVTCAAGYATLKYVIENNIPDRVLTVGAYLLGHLNSLKEKYHFVVDVRGIGLLIAMEFNKEIAEKVVLDCLKAGLLINRVKPAAIRFMPPLIINEQDADRAVNILDSVLSRLEL